MKRKWKLQMKYSKAMLVVGLVAVLVMTGCGSTGDSSDTAITVGQQEQGNENESGSKAGVIDDAVSASETPNDTDINETDANVGESELVSENGNDSISDSSVNLDEIEMNTDVFYHTGEDEGSDFSKYQTMDIRVAYEDASEDFLSEDGAVIYTLESHYPIITFIGHQALERKINAALYEIADIFLSGVNEGTYGTAKALYEEMGITGSIDSQSFTLVRADENIISFRITITYDNGGIQGGTLISGVTFDSKTGEELSLESLSTSGFSFRQEAVSYLYNAAQNYTVLDIIDEEYNNEEAFYQELNVLNNWYLTTTGMEMVTGEFALGSAFSAEPIRFVIPYMQLEKLGLKEEYRYNGRFTLHLYDQYELYDSEVNHPGETLYSFDINDDGISDNIRICAYMDWENEQVIPHFIINGVDYAESDAQIRALLERILPADYCLYDIQPYDDTIEIAILTTIDGEEGSYIFRYDREQNLQLLYLTLSVIDPAPVYESEEGLVQE